MSFAELPSDPILAQAFTRAQKALEACRERWKPSDEEAQDAAEAVTVNYDELPAVVSAVKALESGAPQLHDEAPGNLCFHWKVSGGDVDAKVVRARRSATWGRGMANGRYAGCPGGVGGFSGGTC